ncbi:MAG: hypothetical protein ACRD3J_29530 [Thermoanaerobaculia bacterium]
MTRNQFAMAVNADEKWIENTILTLGLALKFTPSNVTWMGLVRVFSHGMGFTLARSAQLATEAIQHAPKTRQAVLGHTPGREGAILLDLARYHSRRNASLSAAIELGGPRRRGRPPRPIRGDALSRARKYGIDVDALRAGLSDSPSTRLERLEQNVEFVNTIRKNSRRKLNR